MHGRCVSPDTCHCEPGWGGPDCSSGESGVFGGWVAHLLWVGSGCAVCILNPLCWAGAASASLGIWEDTYLQFSTGWRALGVMFQGSGGTWCVWGVVESSVQL